MAESVEEVGLNHIKLFDNCEAHLFRGRVCDCGTAPRLRRVRRAAPAGAPYGRAAIAALKSAGIYDRVQPKLVFGENVAQALQFAQSGAADAAIVALSLALAPALEKRGRFVAVPSGMYPRMEQGGAI